MWVVSNPSPGLRPPSPATGEGDHILSLSSGRRGYAKRERGGCLDYAYMSVYTVPTMVSIRLSRVGKKNHASFRFIVSDKRKDTIGPALEVLGWYDPHMNPTKVEVKADRVQFWLSKGAQPSPTVHNLLVGAGVIKGEKVVVAHAKKPKVDPVAPVKKADAPKAEVKTEEPKTEPAVEAKAEEPKVEEKSAETPAAEVKVEEAKPAEKPVEAPKAEEQKKEEAKT